MACPLEHTITIIDKDGNEVVYTFKNEAEFKTWLDEEGLDIIDDFAKRMGKQDVFNKEMFLGKEAAEAPKAEAEKPKEAAAEPPKKKTTGIKKEVVENETNWSHDITRLRVTHPETVKEATRLINSKEVDPSALAILHANDPTRTANIVDQAVLLIDRTRLMNERDNLNEQIKKAESEGDEQKAKALRDKLSKVYDEWNANSQAVLNIGTALGQSFGFRRRIMAEDYTLEAQEMEWRKDNPGENPTAEQRKKWEEREKEFKDVLDKMEKAHEEALKQAGQQAVENFKEAMRREEELKQEGKGEKKIKKEFKEAADLLRKGKLSRPDIFSAATPASVVWDTAIEVSAKTIELTGDVLQAVVDGLDHIARSDWYKNLSDDKKKEAQQAFTSFVKDSAEPKVKEAKKAEISFDEETGRYRVPSSIIKDYIREGIDNIEDLTDKIYNDMIDEFPDITHREVRDAITGYGETINMPKDEISKKYREVTRIGRLISSIEDAITGKMPLRTGLQRDATTPKVRDLMKKLRNLMKDIPLDDEALAKRYKTQLETVKTRLRNEIEDLDLQIQKGRNDAKEKGIEYDDDASELLKERNRLKAELDRKFPKAKPTDAERTEQLLNILNTHYKKISETVEKAKLGIFTKVEKKGYPEDYRTKEMRDKIKEKKNELKDLKDQYGETVKEELAKRLKAIETSKKRLQEKIDKKDFSTKKKRSWFELTAEERRAKGEYEELKEKYQEEKEKDRLNKRGWVEKRYDNMLEIFGLSKALRASLDASAPFRQGIFLMARHPVKFAENMAKMVQYMASEKTYNKWMTELKGSDIYRTIKESGLYVADTNTKVSAAEEQFVSSIPKKIPIYKFLYKASERAYAGFLNKMRVDVFTQFHDNLVAEGISGKELEKELKDYATFLNSATGRGNFGKLEGIVPVLNSAFFSPRFVKSRIDLINPAFYASKSKKARMEALKTAGAFIGMGLTTMLIAKMAGAETEDDPRSPDFGKIIVGKKRYDIWGGEADMARFFTQLALGEVKKESGEIEDLSKQGFMKRSRLDLISRFARGKLAPSSSIVVDALAGETYMGDPFSLSDAAWNFITPLYVSDLQEIYKEEGLKGDLAIGIPSFFGIGVKYYKPKPQKKTKSGLPLPAGQEEGGSGVPKPAGQEEGGSGVPPPAQ